jgi:hypothetical protein
MFLQRLGVSEKAIMQLAKRGIIAPAPRGRYHLQASVYSYCLQNVHL